MLSIFFFANNSGTNKNKNTEEIYCSSTSLCLHCILLHKSNKVGATPFPFSLGLHLLNFYNRAGNPILNIKI